MLKAILFDFDGVISDSLDQVIFRWSENTKTYGNGMSLSKDFLRNSHTGSWKVFYEQILGIPKNKIDEASAQYKKIGTEQGISPIFPEISKVIEEFSKVYPLYILSSNYETIIKRDLDYYNLTKFFKGIAGHEHSRGLDKSSKEFILNFLEDWNLKADEVVYLGDTFDEVKCGKMAGTKTIGCTWGYQSKNLIESANPDAIAEHPTELINILSKLNH